METLYSVVPRAQKQPHLLIIGAREHTIEKLNRMDISYTIMQLKKDLTIQTIQEAKRVFIIDYQNIEEVTTLASALHTIDKFDAVVSFTEFGLYPAAVIAEHLKVKGNHVAPVEYTRNKIKMRELLNHKQLSTTRYHHCHSISDAEFFYKNINGPFILKPFDGAGSYGVSYVDSFEKIPSAWEWTVNQGSGLVIAEEYLCGKEYSVESLTCNGHHEIIAITEKITTGYPHFIELGHLSPAPLDKITVDATRSLLIDFLALIKHWNGPAHTEIKINNHEIKIIESQTRMGGDQIWELTEITTGVDVISETLAHLLEIQKPPRRRIVNAAAIRFFARENEEIINIDGIKQASRLPGILRIKCTLKSGQQLKKLSSSESRQGYILGIGNTVKQALHAIDNALDIINITSNPLALLNEQVPDQL